MYMAALDNDKYEYFCREFLIDLNATQACIRAGYSKNTAHEKGAQLLAIVSIRNRISELKQERANRLEITADNVVKELARIGFSKIDDFVSVIEMEKEIPNKDNTDEETFEPEIIKYKLVDIKITNNIDADSIRAISSIKQGNSGIEIKLHDKVKSLELIGKHLGIFEKDNLQANKIFVKKVSFK